MSTFLEKIRQIKTAEVAAAKINRPEEELRAQIADLPPPRDFAGALSAEGISLIAEIKRASPSAGNIRPDLDPADQARLYQQAGAAAVSILTETRYFKGSLDDLASVKETVGLPVLRKDFLIDPYQIYQSRATGADAVLLISDMLEKDELLTLLEAAGAAGLAVLTEAHGEEALAAAIDAGARIIGINNRNLKDFTVSLDVTRRLRPLVPLSGVVISESGIHAPAQMAELRVLGVDAVLIGEALVTAPDPGQRLRELKEAGQ